MRRKSLGHLASVDKQPCATQISFFLRPHHSLKAASWSASHSTSGVQGHPFGGLYAGGSSLSCSSTPHKSARGCVQGLRHQCPCSTQNAGPGADHTSFEALSRAFLPVSWAEFDIQLVRFEAARLPVRLFRRAVHPVACRSWARSHQEVPLIPPARCCGRGGSVALACGGDSRPGAPLRSTSSCLHSHR